jgi:hypothetical protein
MLQRTLNHLLKNVLPAANDYDKAEGTLSAAFSAGGGDRAKSHAEADVAKRRAAEVAVAIDGLADRAANALGTTPTSVRAQVSALCAVATILRQQGCLDRV